MKTDKIINDMKKVFTELHEEENTGIPSAIIRELQEHYDLLVKDGYEKRIQKITNDEVMTQEIMDDLFVSYGVYTPLK